MRQYLNWKTYLVIFALGIVGATLYYTSRLADRLAKEEKKNVVQYSEGLRFLATAAPEQDLTLALYLTEQNTTIPVMWVSGADTILDFKNLDTSKAGGAAGGAFLKRKLAEFKEQHPEAVYGLPSAPDGLAEHYLSVPALLQRALEARQLVQLVTHNSQNDPYGYLTRLTEDELLLEVYTAFGEPDGHSVLQVEDVRSVVWSDEETRTIELLIRQRRAAGEEDAA